MIPVRDGGDNPLPLFKADSDFAKLVRVKRVLTSVKLKDTQFVCPWPRSTCYVCRNGMWTHVHPFSAYMSYFGSSADVEITTECEREQLVLPSPRRAKLVGGYSEAYWTACDVIQDAEEDSEQTEFSIPRTLAGYMDESLPCGSTARVRAPNPLDNPSGVHRSFFWQVEDG